MQRKQNLFSFCTCDVTQPLLSMLLETPKLSGLMAEEDTVQLSCDVQQEREKFKEEEEIDNSAIYHYSQTIL